MSRPLTYPIAGASVRDLDFIPIEFTTVTSGNPIVTFGNLIVSITRENTGIYTIVLNGTWKKLMPVGATVTNIGADASTAGFCTPTEIVAADGQTSITVHVGLIGGAAQDSDGSGALNVSMLFAGMQQGAN